MCLISEEPNGRQTKVKIPCKITISLFIKAAFILLCSIFRVKVLNIRTLYHWSDKCYCSGNNEIKIISKVYIANASKPLIWQATTFESAEICRNYERSFKYRYAVQTKADLGVNNITVPLNYGL